MPARDPSARPQPSAPAAPTAPSMSELLLACAAAEAVSTPPPPERGVGDRSSPRVGAGDPAPSRPSTRRDAA
ncbi:hypothetical protein DY218_05035 [Streptomyces triticagri]|uniref:Uncharacterized protein n=1 Tax=Streptomyces triticagri TaxID=2293568 RepID=A0A372MB63_9ACTN|nr:hypothetical protein DY218_05035 [Streptomyces triticagri]